MASASFFLAFLRPLPPPKLQTLRSLQRRISTQPHSHQAISTTSNSPSLTPPPQTTTPSTRQPITPLSPLPYHVHRTASQQLPIYQLAKRGGNLHQTRIRKIEGDVERLKDEVTRALGIREDLVVINRLTGHIVIKGWYRENIKRFLEDRQF